MRQLRVTGLLERDHVANRGNPRHAGPVLIVDPDVAALQSQAGLLGAKARRHRPATRGDEQILAR